MNLFKNILQAQERLQNIVLLTDLNENLNLSKRYGATILLKREDQQINHSFSIRGVYNKISSLSTNEKKKGIISASAGNHAQGVALACNLLKVMGKIYMPKTTTKQKIIKIQQFGKNYIEIILVGTIFDDAYAIAAGDASIHCKVFIHPFDDLKIIAGNGTVGMEILEQYQKTIDYVFVPVEGGALGAGLSSVFKQLSPHTKIIGVETRSITTSIDHEKDISFESTDQYINKVSMNQANNLVNEILQKNLSDMVYIPKGKICTTILQLFNEEKLIVEPTGILSIAALDFYAEQIKGENVVCIVDKGTQNLERKSKIKECSLLYQGLIHYFIIEFPQPSVVLNEFVNHILGPHDKLTFFLAEKKKNNNVETDSALIKLELKDPNNILTITSKMQKKGFKYQNINKKQKFYNDMLQYSNIFKKEKELI
ncbi:threonine ammonia-lyase IlvA [Flavobacterium sp. T12S277]|uniref:threonine ammonia-lyase IlvA n=1 Tax=Flavobacterium sp. T12S277 TaxID=3402752 RepID=UPI003AD9425F